MYYRLSSFVIKLASVYYIILVLFWSSDKFFQAMT